MNDPDKTTLQTEISLQDEWNKLFKRDKILQTFQKSALEGNLGTNRFRSVCWRIFWECLSDDPLNWTKDVKEKRSIYTEIRKKYVINPHQEHEQGNVDLEKHHPLSLAEDSIWNKYFQDNELRNLIVQDLDRLSPDIDFFQQDNIKNHLLHILFCYAREHPQVSYKQGMHEILSPLIYVMYQNCSIIAETKEEISDEIRIVLDMSHIEHDAYYLFYIIMESIQSWYVDLRPIEAPSQGDTSNERSMFQKPESKPVNAISNKLQRIQGSLLQKYDPELSIHLKKIDITPQVYGIRWVRLLFGREFPINRLLILWDGIFANGMAMELVEYIYVAMLIHLRGVLLQNDLSECLMHLMKFPAHTDTRYILKRAVALKHTKKSVSVQQPNRHRYHHTNTPRQSQHQHQHRQHTSTGARQKPSIHPVKYRLGETEEQRYAHALGSGVPTNQSSPKSKLFNQSKRGPSKSNFFVQHPDVEDGRENQQAKADFSAEEDDKVLFEKQRPSIPSISDIRERVENSAHMISRIPNTLRDAMSSPKHHHHQQHQQFSNAYIDAIMEDHSRLQRQVSDLQSQLDATQTMSTYCSQRMEHYLNLMQERLFASISFNDELTILGLAGLKQVREILKGQDLDDFDFSDIDRHVEVAKQKLNVETVGEKNETLAATANFNYFDPKAVIPSRKEDHGKSNKPLEMCESNKASEGMSENRHDENTFKPLTSKDVEEGSSIGSGSPQCGKRNELNTVGPNLHDQSFTERWTDPLSSFNVD